MFNVNVICVLWNYFFVWWWGGIILKIYIYKKICSGNYIV